VRESTLKDWVGVKVNQSDSYLSFGHGGHYFIYLLDKTYLGGGSGVLHTSMLVLVFFNTSSSLLT
jgi:hypothetical protein